MHVVVGVLTFRRQAELARILPMLAGQAAALQGSDGRVVADVLVVDNDPDAGARDFVAGQVDVRYVHEPTPGIAAARNRALDEAAGADALVFVDDDEEPCPGWLDALTALWRESGAAAVTGPVEPAFDAPADAWVRASLRFERRRFPTGTSRPAAASNNLLLDCATVQRLGVRFDESFGLTGGEDTTFTRELVGRGGRILWCDEAIVREHIPADRLTRSWVLRREFRSGTSWSAMRLRQTPAHRRLVVRLGLAARGILRATAGLGRLLFGLITGRVSHQARGACLFAGNAGLIGGAFGQRYHEYGR